MSFDRREVLHLLTFAVGSGIAGLDSALAQAGTALPSTEPGQPMEKVLGIGGFFFRAKDLVSLGRWYEDRLGIALTPASDADQPWRTEAGVTIFSPFSEATHYFGDPKQVWMVNFRVRDLEKMATQLKAAGIAVDVDPKVLSERAVCPDPRSGGKSNRVVAADSVRTPRCARFRSHGFLAIMKVYVETRISDRSQPATATDRPFSLFPSGNLSPRAHL